MSSFVTIWNPNSTPVQISANGLQAPGLSTSHVDASDEFVKRVIADGTVVVLSGATEEPAPATVVEVEAPAEPVVEEAPVEPEPEPQQEPEVVAEDQDEAPKVAKSTRSKSQTASKES